MTEVNIFNTVLCKGLVEIINEQQREYVRMLRDEIIALVESKQDEKVIIKKIIDLLDNKYNHSFYKPRDW